MTRCLQFIAVAVLISGVVLGQSHMVEKYEFEKLESRLEFSANKRFVFARVPIMPIVEYEKEFVRELQAAGRSANEITKVQHSERYRSALSKERAVRRSYPTTGLYDVFSGALLKPFNDYPIECERLIVSDSGTYFVGVNLQVLSDLPLDAGTPMSSLRRSTQPGVYVGWVAPERKSCLLPLSALIEDSDIPSISTAGFTWAKDDIAFDDNTKKILLRKLNNSAITFDAGTCSTQEVDRAFGTPEGTSQRCWPLIAVLIGLLAGGAGQPSTRIRGFPACDGKNKSR
jgi:hypothetical protein